MTTPTPPLDEKSRSTQQKTETQSTTTQQPANGSGKKSGKKFEFRIQLQPQKWLFWLLILLLFWPLISTLLGYGREEVTLSQMVTDIREDRINEIVVREQQLELTYADGSNKLSKKEAGQSLTQILDSAEIDLASTNVKITTPDMFMQIVIFFASYILPALILGAIILFIMKRQMGGGGDGILGMGKSRAKIFNKGKQDTRFKDVGGLKEAKQELEEIVDFLKNPKKYKDVGARVPKGVLLVGPSGTGKTMLARAVAGEANATFLSMAGSEFMEMLVGVGASRARDLFQAAKKSAPSIIFIDEIDAIGRMRGHGSMSGHDEREQTLNQILVEMDGFTPHDAVIVLAATNRGDLLDPALVRPGRFDRRVTLDLPDLDERKFILSIHSKNKPFDEDVNWDRIAKRTVGFSGADLENMLNEAAILIARVSRSKITMEDIEEAALKVKLGPEKKKLQSDYERKMTAYHEAGHAVLAHVQTHVDPVHRISIVSRGRSLGFTMTPPETDKYQQTKSELFQEIVVLLGGRVAEQMIFNEITGGASSDIDRATRIARAMVEDYGMSELGPIKYGPQYDYSDYGRALMEPTQMSDKMKNLVDEQVKEIVISAEKEAVKLMNKFRVQLDAVAKRLLEIESMDTDEFTRVMGMPKASIETT